MSEDSCLGFGYLQPVQVAQSPYRSPRDTQGCLFYTYRDSKSFWEPNLSKLPYSCCKFFQVNMLLSWFTFPMVTLQHSRWPLILSYTVFPLHSPSPKRHQHLAHLRRFLGSSAIADSISHSSILRLQSPGDGMGQY